MTIIEICNQSLSMIGDLTISSLDEQNKPARLCKQFYPLSRDKVLSDYNWSFATAYKTLALNSETPEHSGYKYKYLVPKDMLHIQEVIGTTDFEVIGTSIHSNVHPLTIKYTQKVSNTDVFPSAVSEAISLYLAYKLITPMSADLNLKSMMLQEYVAHLEDAKNKDGLLSQGEPEGKFWVDT
jgi:hypothetical protein